MAESGDERTEVFEVPRRGCLVRVMVRQAEGEERWSPATMTWCPGLRMADFVAQATADAPANAAPPGPASRTMTVVPSPEPERAATPAAPAADGEPPELVELLRDYTRLQEAVVGAFRGKAQIASGELGFLQHMPKVGGFSVPGEGDWVWRIDQSSVTFTSRRRAIELPLPTHLRDDAFDPEVVTAYLTVTGNHAVACDGGVHPVEPTTIKRLIRRLAKSRAVRLFSTQPRACYLVA